jgi:hypothetical protein
VTAPTRLPGLRRLFWFNVAAIVLFTGLAGYHYLRQRATRPPSLESLREPLAAAKGEDAVRAKADMLARLTHHASRSAWHGKRAAMSLALLAAFVLLWNAVSLSELRDEVKEMEDELTDLHAVLAALPDEDDDEDEDGPAGRA